MSYRLGIGLRPSQCTIPDEDLRSTSPLYQNTTVEIARKSSAEIIAYEVNSEKGTTQKTGFAAAFKMGAVLIVTMYSDGHHIFADLLVERTFQNKANKMAKKSKCSLILEGNCCGSLIALTWTLMHSMSAILGNTKFF